MELERLVSRGIISPVLEPTEWISSTGNETKWQITCLS